MSQMNDLTQFVDQVVNRQQIEKDDNIAQYRQFLEKEEDNKKQELLQTHEQQKQQLKEEQKRAYQVSQNSLQLEDRNNKLASKQKLIETYLSDIQSEFVALSADETIAFIESILTQHTDMVHSEIIFGEDTKNKISEWEHSKIAIRDEIIPNKSGFILTAGDVEYNYLFDNLIEESRKDLQKILLNQLSEES